jgi:hypothetical protein
LHRDDTTYGLPAITFPPDLFTPHEDGFLHSLAGALTSAMRRAAELQVQDAATQRTVLLAEASMSLSRSLDLDTTLAEVGRLLVPRFADWCSVQMLNDGRLETVALQHRDPETTEWARSLMGAFPTRMDAPHGAANVVRSGRSEIYPLISTDLIEADAASAEHLALVRRLGLTSAIVVPLTGRDGVVGTVTLIHAESGRRYSEEDCVFLEAVADRVAVALDTAATFEQQSERLAGVTLVAEAAQRAILAPPPGRVGPVALSARYLSAAREAQIGGDLYEVVRGPSSLRLLVGGAAKYSTTVVVPQARVELATFRLGGGCSNCLRLRRPHRLRCLRGGRGKPRGGSLHVRSRLDGPGDVGLPAGSGAVAQPRPSGPVCRRFTSPIQLWQARPIRTL